MSFAQVNDNLKVFTNQKDLALYRQIYANSFQNLSQAPSIDTEDKVLVHVEVPGILDPFLRSTLVEYLQNTTSFALTREELDSCLRFLEKGIFSVNMEEMIIVRSFLEHVSEPRVHAALGLSLAQVEEIRSHLNVLPAAAADQVDFAKTIRSYFYQSNNIGEIEQQYREKMYLVDSESTDVEFIVYSLFQKGTLSQSMSAEEMASTLLDYVQKNFEYIRETKALDGKPMDHWQSVEETVARGGGDCEDLAILQASTLMAALKHKGYSSNQIRSMVKLSAGYLNYGPMAKTGHMMVTFSPTQGKNKKTLVLDATSKSGPISRNKYDFETVFEFNDVTFNAHKEITPNFVTAEEYKSLDTAEMIEALDWELKVVQKLLKLENWDILDVEDLTQKLRLPYNSEEFQYWFDQLSGDSNDDNKVGSHLVLPRTDLKGEIYQRLDPSFAEEGTVVDDILGKVADLIGLGIKDQYCAVDSDTGKLTPIYGTELNDLVEQLQERQALINKRIESQEPGSDEVWTAADQARLNELKNVSSLWEKQDFSAGEVREYSLFNITRGSVHFIPPVPMSYDYNEETGEIATIDVDIPTDPHFYMATIKSTPFVNFMNLIRDKINRVSILFNVAYAAAERANLEGRELHDQIYTDSEKEEVKRERESMDKLRRNFVKSFSTFVSKLKDSLTQVAEAYFEFTTNFNKAQFEKARYKIDTWAREIVEPYNSTSLATKMIGFLANTGLTLTSELINVITGAFDVARAQAHSQLARLETITQGINATVMSEMAVTMAECVQLWDPATADIEEITAYSMRNAGMHFGRGVWDTLDTTGQQRSANPQFTKEKILDVYKMDKLESEFLRQVLENPIDLEVPEVPDFGSLIMDSLEDQFATMPGAAFEVLFGGGVGSDEFDIEFTPEVQADMYDDMSVRENEYREQEWYDNRPGEPLPPRPGEAGWNPLAPNGSDSHYWTTTDDIAAYDAGGNDIPVSVVRQDVQDEVTAEYTTPDIPEDPTFLPQGPVVPIDVYYGAITGTWFASLPIKAFADIIFARTLDKDSGVDWKEFVNDPVQGGNLYYQAPGFTQGVVGPAVLGGYFIDYNMEKQTMLREYLTNYENIVRTALVVQQAIVENMKEAGKSIGGRGEPSSVSTFKDQTKNALETELSKMKLYMEKYYDANAQLVTGVNDLIKAQFSIAQSMMDSVLKTAKLVGMLINSTFAYVGQTIVQAILEAATKNQFFLLRYMAGPIADGVGYFIQEFGGAQIELIDSEFRYRWKANMNEWYWPEIMQFYSSRYWYPTTHLYRLPSVQDQLDEIDTSQGGDVSGVMDNAEIEAQYYSAMYDQELMQSRKLYSRTWDIVNFYDEPDLNEERKNIWQNYWIQSIPYVGSLAEKGPPGAFYQLQSRVPEFVLDRSDGDFGFDGIKLSENRLRLQQNMMKIKILLGILKAKYDAVFNTLSVMFNTRKLNTIADFEKQIESHIELETYISQSFEREATTYYEAIRKMNAQKDKALYSEWFQVLTNYVTQGLTLLAAVPYFPINKYLYLVGVLQLEAFKLQMDNLFGSFAGAWARRYVDGYPGVPPIGPEVVPELALGGRIKIEEGKQDVSVINDDAYSHVYSLMDDGEKKQAWDYFAEHYYPGGTNEFGVYTPDGSSSAEPITYGQYKAMQITPWVRLDYMEQEYLNSMYQREMMVPAVGLDVPVIGGATFQQLDFETFMGAQRQLNKIVVTRVIYLMIEQAIYQARNMATREMFGVSSSAGIMDVAMDAVDRFNQGQLARLNDMTQEWAARIEAYNKYFEDSVLQLGIGGIAQILTTIFGLLLSKPPTGGGGDSFVIRVLSKARHALTSNSF